MRTAKKPLSPELAELLALIKGEAKDETEFFLDIWPTAQRLGISESVCLARLIELEENKYIAVYPHPTEGKYRVIDYDGAPNGQTISVLMSVKFTAAERMARFRAEQKALGRRQVMYWLTAFEKEKMDKCLKSTRSFYGEDSASLKSWSKD